MFALLGLWISKATAADIADLGEEHGHWMLRVYGKGTSLSDPAATCRRAAIDSSIGTRTSAPILLNSRGARDRPPRRRHPAEPASPAAQATGDVQHCRYERAEHSHQVSLTT
jgi:hypothetical protein